MKTAEQNKLEDLTRTMAGILGGEICHPWGDDSITVLLDGYLVGVTISSRETST